MSHAVAQDFWAAPSDSFEASLDDIHVTQTGTVLAGVFLEGIFRSDDAGDTWTMVSESYAEQFAESEGVLFAGGLDGLLRTTGAKRGG